MTENSPGSKRAWELLLVAVTSTVGYIQGKRASHTIVGTMGSSGMGLLLGDKNSVGRLKKRNGIDYYYSYR